MKIPSIRPGKPAERAKKKGVPEGKGGDFAGALKKAAESAGSPGVTETAPVGGVEAILAVQEVPDTGDEGRRRRAVRYGDDLLARLEELQLDLLAGAASKDKLADLARTMREQRRTTDDSRLNEIIDEIELRAEVEIAKLTRGA